jgi:hypothetical protein
METKELISLLQNPTFLVILAWLVREAAHGYRTNLKELTKEISKLSIALVRLETRLEALDPHLESIPKMQADIHALHSKIRTITPNGS